MDGKLRKILEESIREMESGALDMEGCLRRHPERAADLRPHLQLWSDLDSAEKGQPSLAAQQRGHEHLLAALSDAERGRERRLTPLWRPAVARAAAVLAGVALLAAGAAGTSAAFGGPDVADEILTAVGINHADGPDEHANVNASERCENSTEGRGNADEHADAADSHANPRSGEGGDVSGDHCLNAGESGEDGSDDHASVNADERCENATEGRGNADEHADNADGHANPRSSEGGDVSEPNENANERSGDGCLTDD